MIRELCIMAVRLAPKSGSGCEYLSWKKLFWERTNFCLKIWGLKKEEELYKLFTRLSACCSGEEFRTCLDYYSNDRAKIDHASC